MSSEKEAKARVKINKLLEEANLKQTSLFELANMCDLPPQEYIHKFIISKSRSNS